MIEFDDSIISEPGVELHVVQFPPERLTNSRSKDEGRTTTIIKGILADEDERFSGRMCVGEHAYCDERGGDTRGLFGLPTHQRLMLLFDDADTAFYVKMKYA